MATALRRATPALAGGRRPSAVRRRSRSAWRVAAGVAQRRGSDQARPRQVRAPPRRRVRWGPPNGETCRRRSRAPVAAAPPRTNRRRPRPGRPGATRASPATARRGSRRRQRRARAWWRRAGVRMELSRRSLSSSMRFARTACSAASGAARPASAASSAAAAAANPATGGLASVSSPNRGPGSRARAFVCPRTRARNVSQGPFGRPSARRSSQPSPGRTRAASSTASSASRGLVVALDEVADAPPQAPRAAPAADLPRRAASAAIPAFRGPKDGSRKRCRPRRTDGGLRRTRGAGARGPNRGRRWRARAPARGLAITSSAWRERRDARSTKQRRQWRQAECTHSPRRSVSAATRRRPAISTSHPGKSPPAMSPSRVRETQRATRPWPTPGAPTPGNAPSPIRIAASSKLRRQR